MNERLRANKGGVITYSYTIDGMPDIGFKFSLLSEVGERYKKSFLEEIARRGWLVEFGQGLEVYPWCADILVGRTTRA